MFSLNKAFIIGRLGREPEVRHNNNGEPIVSFSVATSKNWLDRESGERKQSTEWHKIVIFNRSLAKMAADRLKKGSLVGIEGELKTRNWEDDKKVKHYSTEIMVTRFTGQVIFLEKRVADFDEAPSTEKSSGTTVKKDDNNLLESVDEDIFDDIPF